MSGGLLQLAFFCLGLFLIQGLAAIPWLLALSRFSFREEIPFYAKVVVGVTACGFVYAFLLNSNSDPGVVGGWGRIYSSVLFLQLGIHLFVLVFYVLLTILPKTGAVSLAAFQEGV